MPDRNRLADATSPYLLQHADNPVHWWEWGDEAFAEARRRDAPVLLSIGYASCHWCHVMAHESFEDDATAAVMNERFINVKVDREERPDVDRIYMDAVQAMTGHGGWPMTVFLTPDGKPFFAGTYFPDEDRHGHPSFRRVMDAIHDAWTTRREGVEEQAGQLTAAVAVTPPASDTLPDTTAFTAAHSAIEQSFDAIHGGFGGAPKFPQAPTLEFLLRSHDRPWATDSLRMLMGSLHGMANGGIHDLIGGGFARYSVDNRWLVPHFEKMLYDNALLARLYARAAQVGGDAALAAVATDTLDYMVRDLRLEGGGFASGEDADSEGEEGTFYVFSWDEIMASAPAHEHSVAAVLGATESGNFEGRNVLHRARSVADVAAETETEEDSLQQAVGDTLGALAELRSTRERPARDDKVIAAWNGLAIRALAEAAIALEAPRYLEVATSTARFVLGEMRPGGRLLRSWRDGRAGPTGFCDDYAAMALACFTLYQATGDSDWFSEAAGLTVELVDLFRDPEDGGFFAYGDDAERLIARPKNLFDNPTPSDNSLAAEAMLHMAAFTGEGVWFDRVSDVIRLGGRIIEGYPAGAGHLLAVALVASAPPDEVAIVGDDRDRLVDIVQRSYRPTVFLAHGPTEDGATVPLLADRPALDGNATAYVCRGFVCDAPTTDAAVLAEALP